MRRVCFALALLLISSGAHAKDYHAVGSICMPTEYTGGQITKRTTCLVWHDYPSRSGIREDGIKADRLIPALRTVGQAAPK